MELNHYHPRGGEIIRAFVRGVNARIAEARKSPESLPLEFRLLGIEPEEWTPEVLISRHQGLVYNLKDELETARVLAKAGPEATDAIYWFQNADPMLELDPAIDTSLLDEDILELYRIYKSPIQVEPEDIVAAHRGDSMTFERLASASLPGEAAMMAGGESIGSNNWALSGRLTTTGAPILANDPHRTMQAPSLRYFVHLNGPGWNVIGGGEPVLPGISIGHNGHGAWGLTVFRLDSEDLYIYETDPAKPSRYRYLDGWEEMRVMTEHIHVRGQEPVAAELRFTRHGPVIYQDPRKGIAVAVRAAWMEVGSAPYLASLRMNQARSWEEFRAACSFNRLPGENMVWADADGNIGWQAAGTAPIRPNWSGVVPVPGDGRYEWEGFLPILELPGSVNPPEGFIATANENLVPAGYRYPQVPNRIWVDPFRGQRLHEVLASGRKHGLIDSMRLQYDVLSIPARTLTALLAPLTASETRTEEARRLLLDWDYALAPQSAAAGIYNRWEQRLVENVGERIIPEDMREIAPPLQLQKVINLLVSPDGRLGPDPLAARDDILLGSLTEAVALLEETFGGEPRSWTYGSSEYKHTLLRHPMHAAVDKETRQLLNVGPAPQGGNGYTVNNTSKFDNQATGASFRVIIDLADFDRSLATNSPGQSGDPESPHYRDLFELWARGQYFPLLYSRDRIEEVSSVQRLVPESR